MNSGTLHLKGEDATSKTFELRFVEVDKRYLLEQLVRVKRGRVLVAERWQRIPLVKEAGK